MLLCWQLNESPRGPAGLEITWSHGHRQKQEKETLTEAT